MGQVKYDCNSDAIIIREPDHQKSTTLRCCRCFQLLGLRSQLLTMELYKSLSQIHAEHQRDLETSKFPENWNYHKLIGQQCVSFSVHGSRTQMLHGRYKPTHHVKTSLIAVHICREMSIPLQFLQHKAYLQICWHVVLECCPNNYQFFKW